MILVGIPGIGDSGSTTYTIPIKKYELKLFIFLTHSQFLNLIQSCCPRRENLLEKEPQRTHQHRIIPWTVGNNLLEFNFLCGRPMHDLRESRVLSH